jgi:hypothetical protein
LNAGPSPLAQLPAFPEQFHARLAQQKLTQDDLLKFDSKGQVTLLHFTDCMPS